MPPGAWGQVPSVLLILELYRAWCGLRPTESSEKLAGLLCGKAVTQVHGCWVSNKAWGRLTRLDLKQGQWTKGTPSDALLSQGPEGPKATGWSLATASTLAFAVLGSLEPETHLPNTKLLD